MLNEILLQKTSAKCNAIPKNAFNRAQKTHLRRLLEKVGSECEI